MTLHLYFITMKIVPLLLVGFLSIVARSSITPNTHSPDKPVRRSGEDGNEDGNL